MKHTHTHTRKHRCAVRKSQGCKVARVLTCLHSCTIPKFTLGASSWGFLDGGAEKMTNMFRSSGQAKTVSDWVQGFCSRVVGFKGCKHCKGFMEVQTSGALIVSSSLPM